MQIVSGHELEFLIQLSLCLVAGFAIGAEREHRGKVAGISTQSYVIAGSMIFTIVSQMLDPHQPARIAAQVVSGVGFLGAGIILKNDGGRLSNVTTAASIWFSAAIGMVIGFKLYLIALIAVVFSLIVPNLPNFDHSYIRPKPPAPPPPPGSEDKDVRAP